MTLIDSKEALEKAAGDLFDYSSVSKEFQLNERLRIRCRTHDEVFTQLLGLHLKGSVGCASCRAEGAKRNKSPFAERREFIHGGTVYRLTCIDTDQVFVGVTTDTLARRWLRHLKEAVNREIGDQRLLNEAITRFGPHAFSIEALERVDHDSEIKPRRQAWIRRLGADASGQLNLPSR